MDYLDKYKRWLSLELDKETMAELAELHEQDDEIKSRFETDLAFGTAGLRSVMGAGTNRMNLYMIRKGRRGLQILSGKKARLIKGWWLHTIPEEVRMFLR